jgi:glycolate oxidase FAD binding subunit
MTVTVEAGLTLSGLQDALGTQGQYLPLDPPLPERATLGGIVATRDSGPMRHAHGGPRDLLIGLKVADPEGKIVKGGSKVVKNVAGYDLPKLYAGSWGTLGLLAELTFRVLPLPESRTTILVSLPDLDAAETLIAGVLDSDLYALFVELFSGTASPLLLPERREGWTLAIGIEGANEDVEWQAAHLRTLCEAIPHTSFEVLGQEAAVALRRTLADFPLSTNSRWTGRAALPSSEVVPFLQKAEALSRDANHEIAFLSHAGVGTVLFHLSSDHAPAEETLELVETLREAAGSSGGSLFVERAEWWLEGKFDPWPHPGDGLPLMQKIKQSLDPKNLWNPGRFAVK